MGPDNRVTENPGNGPSFCFKYPWYLPNITVSMDISRINLERWKMYKKNAGAEDRGVQERTGHEPDEDQEMVSEIWI